MAFVQFNSNSRKGETIALDEHKIVFGRHLSCHCVINHPTVSREHFFIERTGGKFFVVDEGSGNGTFVNNERITWVELKDGDEIKAGPFTLKFFLALEDASVAKGSALTREITILPTSPFEQQAEAFTEEQELAFPAEYLQGIRHFNARQYFEAHEVWEEIWLLSSDDKKLFYQMLIQTAVGLHHYERGNLRGASGMYKNVIEKLERLPKNFMALDLKDFLQQLQTFFAELVEDNAEKTLSMDKKRPMIRLS
jgi:predicted metal-dependent hydrolase